MLSSVGWTGTKTMKLVLKAGRYTYVCDPHSGEMRGSFRVT
jgi:plastocyanin